MMASREYALKQYLLSELTNVFSSVFELTWEIYHLTPKQVHFLLVYYIVS